MACTIHNTAARDAALTILAGRGQVSNELMYAHVKYKLVLFPDSFVYVGKLPLTLDS